MRYIFLFWIILGSVSCTEPQPSYVLSDFIYNNQSGVFVKFILYNNPNDTISIKNSEVFTKAILVEGGFDAPFICDSLEVVFNNESKVLYKWINTSSSNPLLLPSYSQTKINDNHYEFKYLITEQDYLNATK